MTRNFNKPGRDNARPYSRQQSPNHYREERTSRPGRPRLSREAVDRAWESGAPNHHPDYHPRNPNARPAYNDRRNNPQRSEASYSQHGRRPASGNRQEHTPYGRSSFNNRTEQNSYNRPFNGNQSSRSQPFGSRRHESDHHSSSGGYQERSYGQRDRSDNRGNERSYGRRDHSPSRNQERSYGYRGRSDARGQEQPYGYRDRSNGRGNERGFSRRGEQAPHRDTHNPRWQSRPATQARMVHGQETDAASEEGLFEGDYEHFDSHEPPSRKPSRNARKPVREKPTAEERHVTRLPDGRVLKGSRPVQRRQAQFWTEVDQETENLLAEVHLPEKEQDNIAEHAHPEEEQAHTSARTRKPRSHTASASRRARKSGAEKSVEKKPRSTGPKPSQRGFKWPAP